ncbi:MAG: GT4 family glycosyltransferase PelF [Verrucomicrobiae bacterium]|nr:GT4 family glycosyltransferase PelF [Verrucomicrobiae bacterium]
MNPKIPADVCLLLEGTYPYVRGGVSTWVHQLIENLPEFRFALFFIGSERKTARKKYYQLPPNVVSQQEVFLFDRLPSDEMEPKPLTASVREDFYSRVRNFYRAPDHEAAASLAWELFDWVGGHSHEINYGNLCRDKEAWDIMVEFYERTMSNHSFIDYFWTVRFMHLPIWRVLRIQREVPAARLYHSVSTGYAGILGALASRHHNAGYLITEHGIYTKERMLEITQADWIYEPQSRYFDYSVRWRKFKELWIELFKFLGLMAYRSADRVISLFSGNMPMQIEFGAPPEKLEVTPNGVVPGQFDRAVAARRAAREAGPQRQVAGFVGRIVPIKDVKTLLRAASHVARRLPNALFKLFGPVEEDPEYFRVCREMVLVLELENYVQFVKSMPVEEIMPQIDILVLTSISEGLPLVLLEGFASHVPAVATDVGACRELLYGRDAEDKALGRAGLLTGISSPVETADAIVELLSDRGLQDRMGMAGRTRVERFYRQADIMDRYRNFYRAAARPPFAE